MHVLIMSYRREDDPLLKEDNIESWYLVKQEKRDEVGWGCSGYSIDIATAFSISNSFMRRT